MADPQPGKTAPVGGGGASGAEFQHPPRTEWYYRTNFIEPPTFGSGVDGLKGGPARCVTQHPKE